MSEKKQKHFQTLKTATAQIFLGQNYEIPWLFTDFHGIKISLTNLKKFPDLEEKSNFPDFSPTSGHPVAAVEQIRREFDDN